MFFSSRNATRNVGGALLALFALAACAGPPNAKGAPYAAASFADYRPKDIKSGSSLAGQGVDIVEVNAEEVVYIESDASTLKVGERSTLAGTQSEVWHDEKVKSGVALVRSGPFANALLFPSGKVSHAWEARPFEPGYYWFDHEQRVLDWSNGALPAPFPQVASPNRIDYDAFARLDKALARAVASGASRDAASGIRLAAGLRAVHSVRPVEGFPYQNDVVATASGKGPTIEREERTLHRVSASEPLTLTVEGPGTLHIWARAQKDNVDEVAELGVMEGPRERAVGGGTVLRKRLTTYDPSGAESKDGLASLRRAVVHVPPGPHSYKVEARSGTAYVFGILSAPIEHIGDTLFKTKSEKTSIPRAMGACGSDKGRPACMFARALSGGDIDDSWTDDLAKLEPEDRALADILSHGGPRDPTAMLEVKASAGDAEALTTLSQDLSTDLDDNVRGAYERAVARGTAWVVGDSEGQTWTIARLDPKDAATCTSKAEFADLGESETTVRTTFTHERHVLALLVEAQCADKRPILLEVDGQKLHISPMHERGLLHIAVAAESAKVKVTDAAGAKVRAVANGEQPGCDVDVLSVRAPLLASTSPVIQFDKEKSPGLELWLKDDETKGEIDVVSGKDESQKVHIVAGKAKGGLAAVDEHGGHWVRAARVLLPEWAGEGSIKVSGPETVAVRAIGREARAVGRSVEPAAAAAKADPAEQLSEPSLIDASKAILHASSNEDRANAYLARAMLLAHGGAERAATEDAQAAEALGSAGAAAKVKGALRRRPLAAGRLVKTAYGIEPDFDTKAVRCTPAPDLPRVRLVAFEHELDARGHPPYDAQTAIRAIDLLAEVPEDARAERLVARSMARGRWKTVRGGEGASRVARPEEKGKTGALDSDQELRPRVVTGAPFGTEDFASVSADHPARAILNHAGSVHAKVDFVCVARAPQETKAPCPFEVTVPGGSTLRATSITEGKGSIDIPQLQKGAIELRVNGEEGKWTAVARISFDKQLAGTHDVDGAFVLEVPHLQYRYLVKAGQTLNVKVKSPALVRIDAAAEENDTGGPLAILADGREESIALGETKVIAVRSGTVSIRGRAGVATVQVAERVPLEGSGDDEPKAVKEKKAAAQTTSVDLDAEDGTYKDTALKSPAPLGPIKDSLGTLMVEGAYNFGTLREGATASDDPDSYFAAIMEYRRRIESISLTTTVGGFGRLRAGEPTEGAYLILYEDEGHTRLRLTGTGLFTTQNVNGSPINTLRPRGFLEYSARVGQEFFILPRLGFDGYYTSAPVTIKNLSQVDVDDDVYNSYRRIRESVAFLQLLFWWEPAFNTIFYFRARGDYDLTNGLFNHIAGRPGILSVFGDLEIDAYFDGAYYEQTRLDTASFVPSAGATIQYSGWLFPGSIGLFPIIVGSTRFDGGGYQLAAGVQLITSYRRGLRDFSSLELSFPEQTAGGIPWRGEPR